MNEQEKRLRAINAVRLSWANRPRDLRDFCGGQSVVTFPGNEKATVLWSNAVGGYYFRVEGAVSIPQARGWGYRSSAALLRYATHCLKSAYLDQVVKS